MSKLIYDKPIIFANSVAQRRLIDAYQYGHTAKTSNCHLENSGLAYRVPRSTEYRLDPRHPGAHLVEELLSWLCGQRLDTTSRKLLADAPRYAIDHERPLGHKGAIAFRILLALARRRSVSERELGYVLYDLQAQAIHGTLRVLERDRVVATRGARISLNPMIPKAFRSLLLVLGEIASQHDPIYALETEPTSMRRNGYEKSADGAPLIFGTDLRLRTLMALAKHGPLYHEDLRRLTGSQGALKETRQNAPFTRASLVIQRKGAQTSSALDPRHPVAEELLRYLIAMERIYPLPKVKLLSPRAIVEIPTSAWRGDRARLFGGEMQTRILLTVAVLGWTYEALCVKVCTGYYRETVKNALARLEAENILEGDRSRGPGANVRCLTLSRTCPARDELKILLEKAQSEWPAFSTIVVETMNGFSPKSKAHLRQRGLWPPKLNG